MHHLFYLAFAAAVIGISAETSVTYEEMKLPASYQYKRQHIRNLNDMLAKSNLPQIYSMEQMREMNANFIVDEVLSVLDQVLQDAGLDPFNVFTGTVLGVDINVWIGGYSSMAREGDASLQFYSGTTSLTCMANMTNLYGNASLTIRWLGFVISAGADANIESADFKLALRFVQTTANDSTTVITPYVDDFQIGTIGKITVHVFGLGPLNPFINVIADFIANVFKFLVPILLNGLIQDVLQQILDYVFHVN